MTSSERVLCNGICSGCSPATCDAVWLVSRVADECRYYLRQHFGWASLDTTILDCSKTPTSIVVAVKSIGAHSQAIFSRMLRMRSRGGMVFRTIHTPPTSTGRWHALLPGLTRLWREHPRYGLEKSLATVLVETDGPVEVVEVVANSVLVRSVDGTFGWVDGPLGGETLAPVTPALLSSIDPDAESAKLERVARSYLGTPYVLGGTTYEGIDCSGLVQRVYREAVSGLLPRHSADQCACCHVASIAGVQVGDLVFVRAANKADMHVGIVVRGERSRPNIVHASATKGRVIEERLSMLLERVRGSAKLWLTVRRKVRRSAD